MRSKTAFAVIPSLLLVLLALALPGMCAEPRVQDICLGNGTPGPFALSWKHVLPGTETVTVNGLPQMRGLDYTLDADGGAITFTRALAAPFAAEVTYFHDPLQAERNGDARLIPLTVDLVRGERGFLSFNALGKQDGMQNGDLTVGLGMGWQGSQNKQFSSHLYYTPVSVTDPSADSSAQRLGLSVAGSADAGRWALFSFGYARAGVGLENAGDDSLQAGRQNFTLSSRLTPTKTVQAQINWNQSTSTNDPSAGATTNSSVALSVTPNDKTQVSANLGQTATGASGETQTIGLSVDSHPTAKMQVSATYGGTDAPGAAGDSQAVNLKTVLTPSKTLSLETTAGRSQLGTLTTDQQGVLVSLSPRQSMQFGVGFGLRQQGVNDSPDSLNTAIAVVNGTVHPLSFLEVSGSYKSRMAPAGDTQMGDLFDTSAAQIAFAPLKSVRFTGTYAQNPDDGGATVFDGSALQRLSRKGLGLETNFGALGLSCGYDWSRRYDAADTEESIHANLGLRFSAATQLTVGFQTQQNALDPAASQAFAYTVGFTHALGDRFNLSLSGTRSQAAASPSDYNATANLGVKF